MKRTPGNNLRTITIEEPTSEIKELEGLLGIGMKREALPLAKRILKKQSITAQEFNEAVNAVQTLADRLKPWSPLVESAYRRLPKHAQRSAQFSIFSFHCGNRNWAAALIFIPRRFDGENSHVKLAFAMDCVLALGKQDIARKLAKRLPRAIQNAEHSITQSHLMLSLAEYFAREGKWDKAITIWETAQHDETFSQNAVSNIVEIHIARAVRAIQYGFQLIELFSENFAPVLEIIIPGNDKGIQQDAEKKFRKLQNRLEKILPKERRKELGLS